MAQQKSRLGRGLSSLMASSLPVELETPVATPTDAVDLAAGQTPVSLAQLSSEPATVLLADISPNPHQPRRTMNDTTLAELAASLKSNGLIQPIIVRKVGDRYELIAGERRWRAAKLAGLDRIPVVIREVDALTQAQLALVENIQREDLNPIERAQAYRTLMDQLGLTQAELANRLGEERSSVANYVRLLDLSEGVRTRVRDGQLSLGHAKLLAGVPDILEQDKLANTVVSQGLSVRNLERLLANQAPTAPAPRATGSAAHQVEMEKTLSRQLGLRVQLRTTAKKGKGRLILHYASLDQFDEVMQRLGVVSE